VIHDPDGVEDTAGSIEGFGLFDFETVLESVKQLRNVTGKFTNDSLRGVSFSGYEIHCGRTYYPTAQQDEILLEYTIDDQLRPDGVVSTDQKVIGSYLHGLFDHPDALDTLEEHLALKFIGALVSG